MIQILRLKSRLTLIFLLLAGLLAGCDFRLNPYSLQTSTVPLPFDRTNISFAELTYDSRLKRVIVPAAETGTLALVDPETKAVDLVTGFSAQKSSSTPIIGTTSAITAKGMIFALDRAAKKIVIIDPNTKQIVGSAPLENEAEYIRFVPATNELWVTEPASEKIEVFSISDGQTPTLERSDPIAVAGGPVGLLIERTGGLAYTNLPDAGATAVILVQTHTIIKQWGNGCSKARSMAIDEERGYLFVACNEGKVVVMDLNNEGAQLTSQNYGGGLEFIAYNAQLRHLYVPSADSAIVAIFDVVEKPVSAPSPGQTQSAAAPLKESTVSLVRLGTADTALKARCITTDEHNNIWVCDPNKGQLFLIQDTFIPSDS